MPFKKKINHVKKWRQLLALLLEFYGVFFLESSGILLPIINAPLSLMHHKKNTKIFQVPTNAEVR